MKRLAIFWLLQLSISSIAVAQSSDALLGTWQSAHGSGRVEFFKRGESYYGKIVWLREPKDDSGKPKRDINNPEESLRSKPILGLIVLRDFTYKGNHVWGNGKVYDPKSGKTYNCMMSLADKNKLNIRAYFGLSIVGKTETWSRVH